MWGGGTSRAVDWPTKPIASALAKPSEFSPRPLMCEWGATRDERATFVVVVEEEATGVGVDVVAFILTGF